MDVRTIRKIADSPVNLFNGVRDNNCETVYYLYDILKMIKEGYWKDLIEKYRQETDSGKRETLKKTFPGVTFSGRFKDRRLDKNMTHYNQVMVIDIDKKDMTMSYEKTMDCLMKTPFVFCAFQSPSGGIKALAYSEIEADDHRIFFRGVEEYMAIEYGIIIDPSGKNPGRLCFISYDPDMYLESKGKRAFVLETDAPETFNYQESLEFEQVSNFDDSKYEESYDVRFVMSVAKSRAENKEGSYRKGNRNNFIFYLAFVLNGAGIDVDAACDIIFGNYPSLGQEEVFRTVKSAYRYKDVFGTRPIKKKKTNQNNLM